MSIATFLSDFCDCDEKMSLPLKHILGREKGIRKEEGNGKEKEEKGEKKEGIVERQDEKGRGSKKEIERSCDEKIPRLCVYGLDKKHNLIKFRK
jgi:hypothetical protein